MSFSHSLSQSDVDVQKVTEKWTILAFTRSVDCYVIDWGEYDTWDELSDLIQQSPECVDGSEHHILYTSVDEGDGNRNKEVRRFCLNEGEYVVPVKGRSRVQMNDHIQPRDFWIDGHEITTYFINDHVYKSELLFSRIKSDRKTKEAETALALTTDPPDLLDVPQNKPAQHQ